MRITAALALLLLAAALSPHAFAQTPRIASITPSQGMAQGGDAVTIVVENFSLACPICSPPFSAVSVKFGGVASPEVHVSGGGTVVAITPRHTSGTVDVTVTNDATKESVTQAGGFTFTTDVPRSSFEGMLVPAPVIVANAPLPGANGSQWGSDLYVYNGAASPSLVFTGDEVLCTLTPCSPTGILRTVDPGTIAKLFPRREHPGSVLYIQRAQASSFAESLRVRDVSRSNQNAGTELPVVREARLTSSPIHLLNVPIDSHSRAALRLFATETQPFGAPTAQVKVSLMLVPSVNFTTTVTLTHEELVLGYVTQPGYFTINDLQRTLNLPDGTYEVEVTPTYTGWAYVAVTNNDTQLVTAIAPN